MRVRLVALTIFQTYYPQQFVQNGEGICLSALQDLKLSTTQWVINRCFMDFQELQQKIDYARNTSNQLPALPAKDLPSYSSFA